MKSRITAFFLLAFALSWYPWIFALLRGTTSGPNPLGPLIAALIVTGVTEKWSGVRALLGRVVRWRVGIGYWAAAIGLPLVMLAAAAALHVALGAKIGVWPPWRELPDRFLFILLFIGLGEEPGWRGWAVPQLQKVLPPFGASILLAAVWALWHLPLMGSEFPPPVILPFVISLFGATFFLTWLYNRTSSVLLTMVTHATVNTAASGCVFQLFAKEDMPRLWWIYALIWLITGAALLLRDRPAARSSRTSESGRGRTPSPDRPGSAAASPPLFRA